MKKTKTFNEYSLNEAKGGKKAFEKVITLDADAMEDFLYLLANYFTKNVYTLDNMDAIGIADDLSAAAGKVKKRTGN